jgi:hypothetical protein
VQPAFASLSSFYSSSYSFLFASLHLLLFEKILCHTILLAEMVIGWIKTNFSQKQYREHWEALVKRSEEEFLQQMECTATVDDDKDGEQQHEKDATNGNGNGNGNGDGDGDSAEAENKATRAAKLLAHQTEPAAKALNQTGAQAQQSVHTTSNTRTPTPLSKSAWGDLSGHVDDTKQTPQIPIRPAAAARLSNAKAQTSPRLKVREVKQRKERRRSVTEQSESKQVRSIYPAA